MTGFHASGAVFAALTILAGPAAAQAPSARPCRSAPPCDCLRPPRPGRSNHHAPRRVAPDLPVRVDRLSAVDPESVGLIGDDDGGLGVDLWRGTSRAWRRT